MRYLAQTLNINGDSITGPLDAKFENLGSVVNALTIFMIPLGIIILLFSFILAGIDYVTSQGSAEKIKSAQAKMITGVIGFVLLVFGLIVVRLVSFIFGIGQGVVGG